MLQLIFTLGSCICSPVSMELRTLLKRIGLSDKELEIFLAAFPLGLQPASVISERSGIHRITTYITLKRLVEKGLATMILKNNMHYFKVAPAQTVIEYVQQRRREWKLLEEELDTALARLPDTPDRTPGGLHAEVYQGMDGLRSLLHHFQGEEELYVYLRRHSKEVRRLLSETLFRFLAATNAEVYVFLPPGEFTKEELAPLSRHWVTEWDTCELSGDLLLSDKKQCGFFSEDKGVIQGVRILHDAWATSLEHLFRTTLLSNLHAVAK